MIRLWWGADLRFDLIDLLPSDGLRLAFLYLYIVLIIFVMFGLSTRRSSVLAFLLYLSMNNHFPLNNSGADVFLKIGLLIISVSNAGEAFSVDNLLRSLRFDWRKSGFSPVNKPQWAMRVLQLQVCFVYAITFLNKLHSPQWLNGLTVYYVTRSPDLARFDLPFVFDHIWSLKILAWFALILEGAFPVLVWIPACRNLVLLCGALFHLGIEWVCNIPLFELAMIASYVVFIPVEDWQRFSSWLKRSCSRLALQRYVVLFDSDVIANVCLVGFLHRLDLFSRLDIREDSNRENRVTVRSSLVLVWNNDHLTGFEAARHICLLLPMGWLLTPFIFMPLIADVGKFIFSIVSNWYCAASEERNFLIDNLSKPRYNSIYQRLILLFLFVGLICLVGLPRQIFESEQRVRRIEVLDGERLKLLRTLKSYPAEDRSSVLLELAWIDFQEQRMSEAESEFLGIFLDAKAKCSGGFNSDYARSLLNLAVFYRDKHDLVAAEHYFAMLKIYDEQFLKDGTPEHIRLTKARDLSNLALVSYLQAESTNDASERRKLLEKALSLCSGSEQLLITCGSERAVGNLMTIKYVTLRELGDLIRAADAKRISIESLSKSHNLTVEP